jgi:two-component sensor histidine kinase
MAKGMVQVATSIGIWQFPEQGEAKAKALNKDVIATGLLWVGDTLLASTFGRGILMLHQGKVVDSIPYPSNALAGAANRMQLYDGKVYFRMDRNIYVTDPANWEVHSFNTSILGTKDPISDFIVRDDHMFIASGSKLVRIGLHSPTGLRVIPTITIEQVRSNNQPVGHHAPIRLSHQRNSIRINYSIPWFRDQQSLTIEYRLNDGEWRDNEPMSRIIDLPYLSPGDYNVQLRGRLADGRYTPTATVAIDIIPPLYARWWFQLLGVLLLGLGFYTLYRYRLRFVQGQNILIQEKLKLEKELDRSMLASIRSQMNPHFIFNALNTIQSYIYLNDKPNAISYLGKFSSLTRLILEMSNHEKVCLRDEIEALKLYLELEKMRFEESLDMEMDIEPSIKVEQCFIPTMLIQPYVENAVKHGLLHKKDNRSVRILFRLKPNDMLEVTIEDNGIGRKRSAELNAKSSRHKPFSTEANQKRLEIMNKAIPEGFTVTYIDRVDAQGRAEGTTVVLLMPLR